MHDDQAERDLGQMQAPVTRSPFVSQPLRQQQHSGGQQSPDWATMNDDEELGEGLAERRRFPRGRRRYWQD